MFDGNQGLRQTGKYGGEKTEKREFCRHAEPRYAVNNLYLCMLHDSMDLVIIPVIVLHGRQLHASGRKINTRDTPHGCPGLYVIR